MIINIVVISTKTSLKPFFEAVEEVNKISPIKLSARVFYTHELDERREESLVYFREAIRNADVVFIDVRTPTSWFVRELRELVSNARIVVPLVGGSIHILSLLRLGSLRGDFIARRAREVDMDTPYLDMSKTFRFMEIMEKAPSIGFLKHAKNWVKFVRYWTYHGRENLKNMLLFMLNQYFDVDIDYEEPRREAEECIWDPESKSCVEPGEYDRLDPSKPLVAMLLYGGMHFEQTRVVAEELYKRFRARGVETLLIVGGGSETLLRQSEFIDEVFKRLKKRVRPCVFINLQWFRIKGGPYCGPPESTYKLLESLDTPLVNGLIMYMREIEKWLKDPRGLSPVEVLTGVALPEADGAIEPIPLAGLSSGVEKDIVVIDDRIEKRVNRVLKWINLRMKQPSERRIAIIIYNYPPGEHNVGSASYLDVLGSVEALLKRLSEAGYATKSLSKEELKERLILNGLINNPLWFERREAETLDTETYLRYFNQLPSELREEVTRFWGSPPGEINVWNKRLVIPGIVLGNVFIGVQPSRGFHEDPSKLVHSKDLPPHHQYLAFYYWLREIFRADAIIHLGTHGTLEFMPGKEIGLSSRCYPDTLIGDTPHIYIYHVTNPSEMSIAKRRGYAYVITHATPAFTVAGLYEDYVELEDLIHEYREALVQDPSRVETIHRLIEEKAKKLNLFFRSIDELEEYIYEMKRSVIPKGLHVLGKVPGREEIIEYLTLVARYDRDEAKSLHRLVAEAQGLNYDELLKRASKDLVEIENRVREIITAMIDGREVVREFPRELRRDVERSIEFLRDLYNRVVASDEIRAILRALDGGYVPPRVAGDPIRTPEAYPTGSHGYAFDPRLIPSKAALERGAKIAEEMLKRYYEKHGRYPESIGVVLWAFETAGTRGETIGQILRLLGVRLVRRHGPWQWDLEVTPLEELGRPRIDVVVTICGIFRDMFPNLITMIDRAVKLVASLNEPENMNYVKKHMRELREHSTLRIFGPKPGQYATRLPELIETSAWRTTEDLVKIYIEDMSYGYGENIEGAPSTEVFKKLLSSVEAVSQIRYAHEYEITDLDHYYEFFGGLKSVVETLRREKIESIWIDTTTERIKYKEAREAIEFSARTRLLNPKWIENMLKHGYDGVREIAKRVEYVLGLAATTGEVPDWVFNEIAERYLFNEKTREEMMKHNRWAVIEIAKRLYEGLERGLWRASEENIDKLRRIYTTLRG